MYKTTEFIRGGEGGQASISLSIRVAPPSLVVGLYSIFTLSDFQLVQISLQHKIKRRQSLLHLYNQCTIKDVMKHIKSIKVLLPSSRFLNEMQHLIDDIHKFHYKGRHSGG